LSVVTTDGNKASSSPPMVRASTLGLDMVASSRNGIPQRCVSQPVGLRFAGDHGMGMDLLPGVARESAQVFLLPAYDRAITAMSNVRRRSPI